MPKNFAFVIIDLGKVMTFKNYLKISFANFDKTWKLIFYRIIVWAVVIGLIAPFYNVLKDVVVENWNASLAQDFIGAGLFYGKNIAITFAAVVDVALSALSMLFTQNLAAAIYICVVLFVLRPFFMNIGRYVVNEMMYGYMSSHAKHAFSSTWVRTMKKSSLYALFRTLFCLPFNVLCAGVFYLLLCVNGSEFAVAMPFIFLMIATILLSIKHFLTMGWAPAMVVSGESVYSAFGIGIKAVARGGARSLLFCIATYFVAVLLALGFGVISIIVLVPIFNVVSSMFEIMNFFSCQGMRYYVDKDTILSSKKLEEQDTISKAKFLL